MFSVQTNHMVVHLQLDLDHVPEFDPCSTIRTSTWPGRWLEQIQFKLCDRMRQENDEQLQFLLKHLFQEAVEVKTLKLTIPKFIHYV